MVRNLKLSFVILFALIVGVGCPLDGINGIDGIDGINGIDGRDGRDGIGFYPSPQIVPWPIPFPPPQIVPWPVPLPDDIDRGDGSLSDGTTPRDRGPGRSSLRRESDRK